jgi:uncharacterized protein YutE (UPF0331/DUF86 family)
MSKKRLLSRELIQQKSKGILADCTALNRLLDDSSFEALIVDKEKCTLAERYLERIVNRAIDINMHIIRVLGDAPPDDYTGSFTHLATLRVLTPALAHAIAPAAGARNILVHEYDNVDMHLFYSSLTDAVQYFPQYIGAINAFIEKQSGKK